MSDNHISKYTPQDLILKLYDRLLEKLEQKQSDSCQEILITLKNSLNFSYEISSDLYELYDYCQRRVKRNAHNEVIDLIKPIRDAWEESIHKQKLEADEQED